MVEYSQLKTDEISLKTLKDMSFEDICKKQIMDCLQVGNTAPENLP